MYNIEQIKTMVESVGGILIGNFKGMKVKIDFQCPICNKIYQRAPECVIRQKQLLCNKCRYATMSQKNTFSQEYIEQAFIKRNFILLDQYVNSNTKVKVRCCCGKEFDTLPVRILNNRKKSCGLCDAPNIGDKFGSLTITKLILKANGYTIEALCDCGRIVGPYGFSRIKYGKTKSCGHCHNPKIGDKFGKLTIIEILEAFNGGCQIICKCDCGELWGPKCCSIVLNGNTTTCGNCEILRNGIPTSNIALKLHDVIEKILGQKCEHNYKIEKFGYIDIVQSQLKIAIEYDGYYWHKDKLVKDELRYNKLVKIGWKLLNIKSGGCDLPSEDELRIVLLNHFQHGVQQHTITMCSWTKAKKKLEQ